MAELASVDISSGKDFAYLEALQDCLGPTSVFGESSTIFPSNEPFVIIHLHELDQTPQSCQWPG